MARPTLISIALLVLASIAIPLSSALAGGPRLIATVDPRVVEDTADGAVGDFMVVLRDQADARGIADLASDPAARGGAVVTALRDRASATQPPVAARIDAMGGKRRAYWIVNAIAVEGDRRLVDELAARPDVAAIESDRPFRVPLETPVAMPSDGATPRRMPLSPDESATGASGVEWNVTAVGAPTVWGRGRTGVGAVVASADTGVQWDHPALISQYRGWNGVTVDHDYNWWDAIHDGIGGGGNSCGFDLDHPCDDHGHGTHTTGTMVGDDGGGNQIGVAPGAKWIACRNMDAGVGRPSTYVECLQFFVAPTDLTGENPDPSKRPDVIDNSYGCPTSEQCVPNSLLAAVQNVEAAGIFFAAAAGNYGSSCSTVADPPAIYGEAFSVGAINSSRQIASFSSRGPVTVDGSNRRKPDVTAPGVGVRSTYNDSGYTLMSGTSMAAPHVAGSVALLWSSYPYLRRDVTTTERIIAQTAQHLTTGQICGEDSPTSVPNNVYGYGALDAAAADECASAHCLPTPVARLFFPVVRR